jgi:hypothetical protein
MPTPTFPCSKCAHVSADADGAIDHALAGCVATTVVTDDKHSDLWHSHSFKALRQRQAVADAHALDAHGATLRAEAKASGQARDETVLWA